MNPKEYLPSGHCYACGQVVADDHRFCQECWLRIDLADMVNLAKLKAALIDSPNGRLLFGWVSHLLAGKLGGKS